ncbi:MAG: hypothetical protein Q9169_004253 [Polycauliona sp. 2 TL-2023]
MTTSLKNPLDPVIKDCDHQTMTLSSSSHAAQSGYKQSVHKPPTQRKQSSHSTNSTYPAPLVLPGDELALDPKYPPQSVRSWQRGKDRNAITPQRNVIYVAAQAGVDEEVDCIESWTRPNLSQEKQAIASKQLAPSLPAIQDITSYLSAFYHPLSVKACPIPLTFTSWEDTPPTHKFNTTRKRKRNRPIPSHIALRTDSSKTQIRTRSPSPDALFPAQLNLNDLIDLAIDILPTDAYALILLVSQDLYEDDEDVFVCGRAYGGSRVAVISTARYNPDLDDTQAVDRLHAWPASHCSEYINAVCNDTTASPQLAPRLSRSKRQPQNPSLRCVSLESALLSHLERTPSPTLLWLIRTCQTCAHELGHCFGLDHCVYHACSMQGSASLAEDARQPPILCPVCAEKVLLATGADSETRTRGLLDVAAGWGWGALEGWCKGVLETAEQENHDGGTVSSSIIIT